eukprot:gene10589-22100_t
MLFGHHHKVAAGSDEDLTEYSYCMVLKSAGKTKNSTELDENGKGYIEVMHKNGLETMSKVGTFNSNEIFVFIKIPLEKLRVYCDLIDFPMLLDPVKLKQACLRGDLAQNIAPFDIRHDPAECKFQPYEYIYALYKHQSHDGVSEELYWREAGQSHPFREIIALKICLSVIESKPDDGGENIKIQRYIEKQRILGFYPLHNRIQRDIVEGTMNRCCQAPWRYPVNEMKEYFGEKIALYFNFISHYVSWLILPAIIGIVLQLIVWSTGDFSHPVLSPFSVFIVLWAIIMLEVWKRKEKYTALKWGTVNFELQDRDRADFRGERMKSHINGSDTRHFPTRTRLRRVQGGIVVVAVLICIVVAVTAASIVNAIQIQIFNIIYSFIAEALVRFENHRTETAYEDSLIAKLFLFQFVNSYASFFYLAFIAHVLDECVLGSGPSSCMAALAQNLGIIFGSRITLGNMTGVLLPYITFRMNLRKRGISLPQYKNLPVYEQEFLRTQYVSGKGSIQDFAETAVEFGYMVMFVVALPIAPLGALISNMLQLKFDSYKLLHMFQRPLPQGAEDIGAWQGIFTFISIAAVLTNAGLIVFTMDTLGDY